MKPRNEPDTQPVHYAPVVIRANSPPIVRSEEIKNGNCQNEKIANSSTALIEVPAVSTLTSPRRCTSPTVSTRVPQPPLKRKEANVSSTIDARPRRQIRLPDRLKDYDVKFE